MKCLTLTQPWATLIFKRDSRGRPFKLFETRSWKTNYRGTLAIHAAIGFPKWAKESCCAEPFKSALGCHYSQLPIGSVLGTVTLVNCIPTSMAINHRVMTQQEMAFGDFSEGRFAWLFDDQSALSKPRAMTGALGLWELNPLGLL